MGLVISNSNHPETEAFNSSFETSFGCRLKIVCLIKSKHEKVNEKYAKIGCFS
jgi:hypothetical protein